MIEKIIEIRSAASSASASIAVASLAGHDVGRTAQRTLCDRLLLQLANRMAAAKTNDWEIRRSGGSPPSLYRAGERCNLNASVAHCGLWVAVGVASGSRIGVDIQVQNERQRSVEMAEFLDLDATAAISQTRFFSCWTLREAIAKVTNGSVLTPHARESELAAACAKPGQVVWAGTFSAMVDVIHPGAHLAIVLDSETRMSLCA